MAGAHRTGAAARRAEPGAAGHACRRGGQRVCRRTGSARRGGGAAGAVAHRGAGPDRRRRAAGHGGCDFGRGSGASRRRAVAGFVPMPKMIFVQRDGTRLEVDAPLGLSVLEIAHRNDIDIEGACEGSLACSTCHVIVDPEWYELLQDASEDEEDMLDLAFGLTNTSRLGCQIIMTEELDGLTVRLPAATRNMLLR